MNPPDPLEVIHLILFWPFVLLSVVAPNSLEAQILGSQQQSLSLPPSPFQFIKGPEATYENEETIEWEDWKGRKRKITVHRKAKVN